MHSSGGARKANNETVKTNPNTSVSAYEYIASVQDSSYQYAKPKVNNKPASTTVQHSQVTPKNISTTSSKVEVVKLTDDDNKEEDTKHQAESAAPAQNVEDEKTYADEEPESRPTHPIEEPDYDESTTELLQYINEFNDNYSDSEFSIEQLSITRNLIIMKHAETMSILNKRSEMDGKQVKAALNDVTETFKTTETNCAQLQMTEIDVLRSIFGSNKELAIYNSSPICIRVFVVLDSIDCVLELSFAFPTAYPLLQPVIIKSFIPPPFNTIVQNSSSLQSTLEAKTKELIGSESSVYEIVTAAREYIESNVSIFKNSMERAQTEQVSNQIRLLTDDTKSENVDTIFGREKIEQLLTEYIDKVSNECHITKAEAKVILRSNQWNVDLTIEDYHKKQNNKSNDDALPSTTKISLKKQNSTEEKEDLETQINHYNASYSDPEHSFSCLSCFEDFQYREGIMMNCLHFACFPCYSKYILSFVNGGDPFLRCLGHKCSLYIEEGLIQTLLKNHDYQRYRRWLEDSLIKLKSWTWCSNSSCNYVHNNKTSNSTVYCYCGGLICTECSKEAHFPASCAVSDEYSRSETIEKLKNEVHRVTKNQNTKKKGKEEEEVVVTVQRCPRCKTPWERNGGRVCKHEFCYICLQDWHLHGYSYFECKFTDKHVKATRVEFLDVDVSALELEVLNGFIKREMYHSTAQSLLAELRGNSELLNNILSELPNLDLGTLLTIMAFLYEAHNLIRYTYVHLTQYKGQLNEIQALAPAKQVLMDLNRLEYFMDIADRSIIPHLDAVVKGIVNTPNYKPIYRLIRNAYQLNDSVSSIKKYAKSFIVVLEKFANSTQTDAEIHNIQAEIQRESLENSGLEDSLYAQTSEGRNVVRVKKSVYISRAKS